jgi:predicted dehydrogenase
MVMVGEDAYSKEIGAFVACVRDDVPSPIPSADGLEALRVSLAALESLETGRAVTIATE